MSSEQETDGTYRCTECDYEGDEYRILDDGSTGGTAVCPECEGQLTI
ncbi:hypothetical protein C465_05256 [Halorubrum distributum JCM 9100]|uniref:Small CPxCG-related zinc finger protein n=2 Tax=Halorubrum distributum TaxID=29283 RepID=M0EUE7_9EURY|nr:hypothetical protein [Halorubrum distributum]ELZ50723.1 hypothetical protein C465_05256 [Halorubrum distributum JCM 9100]ELZ52853.1 hypothetical protein C466_09857 [Halorubrum distributum JCM 10118]